MSEPSIDIRHDRLATAAIVASVLGLVIPIVAPTVGVGLAFLVLSRRRDRSSDDVSRRAAIAAVVGVAMISIPVVVVGIVKLEDWTAMPLIVVAVVGAAVVASAVRLGGFGGGTAALAVAGTVAGVSALAVFVIAAVVAIGWLFALLVRTVVGALFGTAVPGVG